MADEIKKDEAAEEIKKEALSEEKAAPIEAKEKTPEEILKEKDDKIAELNDKYLRALAESENARKRMMKERDDFVKYTRGDTASMFLPVVDNFERAVTAAEKVKDFHQLKKGIDMVLKQFEGALKELGLKEVDTNKTFDPNFHHAVQKEHVKGKKEGEIIEVYQKGWMIDDKIVRPAMVKIAHDEPAKKDNNEHAEHKDNSEKKKD